MNMIAGFQRKLNNLLSDEKFSEILTGSAFALVAKVVGTVMALLSSVLVARVYGAEMMGILAIVQSFMLMASIFAVLGTNVSILRLIPEHLAKYSATSAFHIYRKTQYLVGILSVVLGGGLFFAAGFIAENVFSKPQLTFYIAVTALCVIFRALMDLNTQSVRGLRLVRTFAFMQILPHAVMLIVLVILISFSNQPSDPINAQLVAWAVTSVIGIFIMHRAFHHRIKKLDVVNHLPLRKIIELSLPMFMTASMSFIIAQTGVFILAMYRPASEVGYYAVAVKLSILTIFVLGAINSMAAPKFSELYHSGHMDELFRVAKKSTKLIFWTTMPILFFLVVLGPPVLNLFGEGFEAAYFPLLILVLGQFVNSISGSTGCFMNMTGHQKVFRNIVAVASIINLVLSFVLIPRFGIYGAAWSGSLSLAVWNIGILIYIKTRYGRTLGYVPFVKIYSQGDH